LCKACGVGVNLTEASRVILLDLVWNPSWTKQAIGRAFRIGQKKVVHVYQLVAHGTLEEEKWKKADWKVLLSSLIFIGENSGGDHIGQHVQQQGLQIEDDMLKQLVERDHMSMFQRIFKHEDIHKHKSKTSNFDDILHFQ
jgi:DNA repair and recombination RAD54-like protein